MINNHKIAINLLLNWAIIGISILLFSQQVSGQSLVFSQYYFSPLNINPAMAGTYQNTYFGLSHRSQWRNLNNPYKAQVFSFSQPVITKKPVLRHVGNFALSAFSENAGNYQLYKSWGINVAAAYNIPLDYQQDYTLILGLEGGIIQKTLNREGLRWGSQYNPQIGYDVTIPAPASNVYGQRTFPVFNTGFIWFYNPSRQYLLKSFSAFGGMSMANLNRPDLSFLTADTDRAPLLMKIHGGLEYAFTDRLTLLPGALVMFNWQQKGYLNLGTYLHYKIREFDLSEKSDITLLGGVWYRWNDSFVLSGGLDFKNLTISTSIDLNNGKMDVPGLGGGAYEVSVAYKILKKTNFKRFYTPMI